MSEKRRAEIKSSIQGLDEVDVAANPVEQFRRWFDQAHEAGLREPTAMTVSSVSSDGRPSSRILLLKSFDDRGFVFYTNYTSRKGRELDGNPSCSLLFYWVELERQVRIQGDVARILREESEAYFHSRPRGSQIGAWASKQSAPLVKRSELEAKVAHFEKQFEEQDVPLPDWWGGYRLVPEQIEFWQGGQFRLHDRLVYTLMDGVWEISRLNP